MRDPSNLLMGIVNVTPDSFSDGQRYFDPAAALAQAQQLAQDGAAIIDLGAEATSFFRPGVVPVPAEEQLRRLMPVLAGLPDVHETRVSIDTRSSVVARAAVAAGADIINDVSAGLHDPAMLRVASELGVPVILMHISACFPDNPPQDEPDIVDSVTQMLLAQAAAAQAHGVERGRIWLDPGLGFGKTPHDNWRLALRFARDPRLAAYPVVLGASRKRFVQQLDAAPPADAAWLSAAARRLTPTGSATSDVHRLDPLSAALVAYHAAQPPRPAGLIHRVHHVALAAAALAAPA